MLSAGNISMASVKPNPPHELLQFCNNVNRHMGKGDLDTNIFGFSRSCGQGSIPNIITETGWKDTSWIGSKRYGYQSLFKMETSKQWGTSGTSFIQLLHQ